MPRPKLRRWIESHPTQNWFKPAGVTLRNLEEVVLSLDEIEAIRLSDLEGMYQETAAERMNVSRQTLGRILQSAHRKIAEALVQGKAIRLQGGSIQMRDNQENEKNQKEERLGTRGQGGRRQGGRQGRGRGCGLGQGRGSKRGRGGEGRGG